MIGLVRRVVVDRFSAAGAEAILPTVPATEQGITAQASREPGI
jgi:hypothetical protein